ncbi:MAG: AtpZ/AtpI family protein [Bacteroidales bacterium]|nr:AtpZ/AtpI family protein [Bacteroidales bacterium]MCF8345094.1 AtpZ/AtpI family protein [Bacteroidales bacterium]MCF8351562.1 AtpZ/AtpI family protein [Bacteroidales bacterium]MCF8376460.1 AtpZ/AtpI family protein [Bacteroidales bacterium]MCF8400579.1 AtpZ/AtpI family protein [Bacteroidales bacterium]
MKDQKEKKKLLENYAKYTTIAFQMLVIILAGVFGGIQLDKLMAWEVPVFTLVFSILSVILAIYYVTKDLLKKK